jgi:hypothetical protein
MDDRHAQFLIAIDDLCTAAGLAGLEVHVQLRDGQGEPVRGVPSAPSSRSSESGGESDETGYARTLAVGDHIVGLESVEALTVYAPAGRELRTVR